jgi:DNA-binding transcriptional LysR family regulator
MELRNLRAFAEVARCGGFSAAARAIGSTQSTVSKAVSQLEHDCGTKLVQRLGRGLSLTEAGELVRKRAETMLKERELLVAELADLQGLLRGRLRLGLPVLASGVLFAAKVAAFRKQHPQVQLQLTEHRTSLLEEGVRKGEIEIGATLLPVPRDFAWRLIHVDTMMVLLPNEHPLAKARELSLQQLAKEQTILLEEGFAVNALVRSAYRRLHLRLRQSGTTGNVDFTLAMVASGMGIAFLPKILLGSRPHPAVRAIAVRREDLEWQLAAIWRKSDALSAAARRWIELVELRKA